MLTVAFGSIIFLSILGFYLTVSHYEETLNLMDEKVEEYRDQLNRINRENRFLRNELEKGQSV